MTRKFCPRCGKSVDKLYDSLCDECYLERLNISKKLPDKLLIYVCKECENFYVNDRAFTTIEEAIEHQLKNLKHKELDSVSYRISGDKLLATFNLKIDDLEKDEEKTILLQQPKITCKYCAKKLTGYYTTILQLRGNFDVKSVLKEVEKSLEKIRTEDKSAFISKIIEKREGVDLFLGSKSSANKVTSYLKNRYKTKTNITRTLYGTKLGKRMYRDTILILFGE